MKRYYALIVMFYFVAFLVSSCSAAGTALAPDTAKQEIALSGKVEDGTRVVEVKTSKYKFDPDPIVVKLGEKIRIVGTSTDVAHGFGLAEFKVNLVISPGKTQSVEFVADKAGEFTVECTVFCGPGHEEMHGKFIVLK